MIVKHITSQFNEKVLTRREMNGNGIGRGRDSIDAIDSLEKLLQERKEMLSQAELRWNANFSEEERNKLLHLRENWSRQKILSEHESEIFKDEKIFNKLGFVKYRLRQGYFNDDLPSFYEVTESDLTNESR